MRPQHSLHSLFLRLCSRMPAQPRLLHWLLLRCSQMLAPPHSLHSLLFQLSSQDAYPTALLALSPCPVMLTDSHNSFTLSPFPAPLCSSGPPTVPSCSSFWPDFPNREETSHRQIDTRRRLPTRLLLLFSLDAHVKPTGPSHGSLVQLILARLPEQRRDVPPPDRHKAPPSDTLATAILTGRAR